MNRLDEGMSTCFICAKTILFVSSVTVNLSNQSIITWIISLGLLSKLSCCSVPGFPRSIKESGYWPLSHNNQGGSCGKSSQNPPSLQYCQTNHTDNKEALRQVQAKDSDKVKFTLKYMPYQLYPGATKEGEDKYGWYKKSRYGDSEEKMKMYITLMTAYGVSAGINYKFGGTVANTLDAHRVIQYFQEKKGAETADKIVKSLYRQYFEEEKHPSSEETLVTACVEAGVPESEAKALVDDKTEELMETKMLIREQTGNGVDSVPYIVIEGKRRDITVIGAKEVEDYVKALEQVMKESS
jgi:predicted DsbA family dithiol-disulfide isomerase